MRLIRRLDPSRFPPLLAVALLLPLAGACAAHEPLDEGSAPVAPAEQVHKPTACAQGGPRLTLGWAQLEDDASAQAGDKLTLSIANHLDQPVDADLTLRIHADGRVIRKSLGRRALGPLSSAALPIDLTAAGVVPSDLVYAAQLFVDAALSADGQHAGGSSTPAAYFHAEPATGKVLVYRERAYRERFGAGDFRGRDARQDRDAPLAGVGIAHEATADELHGDPTDGR